MNSNDVNTDFETFMSGTEANGALLPSDPVLAHVRKDFQTIPSRALAKLALSHLGSMLLSVAMCPQFGLQVFKSMGIMHVFMKLGHLGCLAACGIFFMLVSLLCATVLMRLEELAWLKQKPQIMSLIVVSFSLSCFWMFAPLFTLSTATLVWTSGAFLTLWTGYTVAPRLKRGMPLTITR